MAAAAEPKPAVAKVQQLLHRRFKVTLTGGRVVVGDFQCLDKDGNLILGNACEIISHASAAPSPSKSGGGGGGGANGAPAAGPGAPLEKHLGIVLVPVAVQRDVQLMTTLSERAAMLQLVDG